MTASGRVRFFLTRNDAGCWGLTEPTTTTLATEVWRSTEIGADGTWVAEACPALRHLTQAEAAATELTIGDLLVTKSSGSARHVGKTAIAEEPQAGSGFSNFMQRLRVRRRQRPRYYWYLLNSPVARRHYERAATTTSGLRNLTGGLIGEVPVPIADGSHQSRIADFLDRECERIEALRESARRLGLRRRELAIAVTRDEISGAGVPGPRRAPGLGWLDPLPEDWPVLQIRWVARTGTGHTPSRSHEKYWIPDECSIPWFTLADVWQIRDDHLETVADTAEMISPVGIDNSAAELHPAGTVLLSRTASIGFSAVMGRDMAVSQDFMTWTCGERLDPYFLLYALRSMRPELLRLMAGSTHKTIYMPDLHALRIPLPPIDDQRSIVERIRARVSSTVRLGELDERLDARLSDYRDALIAEAVTGQLDVTKLSKAQMDESARAAAEGEAPEVLAG